MAFDRQNGVVLVLFCIWVGYTYGVIQVTVDQRTQSDCNHASPPEFSYTVRFTRLNRFRNWPGKQWYCDFTFAPELFMDGLPTTRSVSFRDQFILAPSGFTAGVGTSIAECGKAWIQLYENSVTPGNLILTHCSDGQLPQLSSVPPGPVLESTTVTQWILRVHLDFTLNQTTANVNQTTTLSTLRTDYPEVKFFVDFTSYLPNSTCNIVFDETKYIRCNDSRRCIHKSNRCDFAYARNCRTNQFINENSDIIGGYPSYCGRQKLPEVEIDLTPLWILLGILGALLVMYWCCWKPGYVPWRCGRLRNTQGGCCGSTGGKGCCAAGGICGAGGLCGAATAEGKAGACSFCSKCFKCCQGGGGGRGYGAGGFGAAGFAAGKAAGGKGGKGGQGDGKQGGAGDWRDYCAGDGFHLTECR